MSLTKSRNISTLFASDLDIAVTKRNFEVQCKQEPNLNSNLENVTVFC